MGARGAATLPLLLISVSAAMTSRSARGFESFCATPRKPVGQICRAGRLSALAQRPIPHEPPPHSTADTTKRGHFCRGPRGFSKLSLVIQYHGHGRPQKQLDSLIVRIFDLKKKPEGRRQAGCLDYKSDDGGSGGYFLDL